MKRTLFALAALTGAAHADEGMWLYNHFPTEKLKAAHGFAPDAAWLDHVRQASVRLEGGCSASFVSAEGLVLTNHHCVEQCVQEISTPERDHMANGFMAKTRAEEVKCPAMAVNVLTRIEDVTERVQKARVGKTDAAGNEAVKGEIATIEQACQTDPGLRCQVVKLFNGGLYDLYTYRRYEDVRLAFAPELATAFFGGDPDNFMFPRYCLDSALVRVYHEGQPLKPIAHLPFATQGLKAGDLTFVSGHPGSTSRQQTVAQIETWRDHGLIPRLLYLAELRGSLLEYANRGAEQARHSRGLLFGVENSFKAFRGELAALLDPAVMAQKRAEEQAARDHVAADPKRQAAYGKAWEAIEAAQRLDRTLMMRHRLIEGGRGTMSELLGHARVLVRAADELKKPNEKRLREYTEGDWPAVKQNLLSEAPVYPEFEVFTLTWSLGKLREVLGPDDPFVKQLLGKESPAELAKRVIQGTKLADPKARQALLDGGATAIAQSTDPLIVLARLIDPEARALRKRREDEVEAVVSRNQELIAKARFEQYGTQVYPDATFTLRLSYGVVQGWEEAGRTVEPFTTLGGAFNRHTGAAPFALPASWLAKKDRIDAQVPFNFVTTNDIIGGNSGSPVVNRDRQVVGLIFDGNIHSLGGDYAFDPALNRAVAVDARAILYALDNIYELKALAQELKGGK